MFSQSVSGPPSYLKGGQGSFQRNRSASEQQSLISLWSPVGYSKSNVSHWHAVYTHTCRLRMEGCCVVSDFQLIHKNKRLLCLASTTLPSPRFPPSGCRSSCPATPEKSPFCLQRHQTASLWGFLASWIFTPLLDFPPASRNNQSFICCSVFFSSTK